MEDAHNALDATGVQAWAVSMHLTAAINGSRPKDSIATHHDARESIASRG
jgi:hypothetical protein